MSASVSSRYFNRSARHRDYRQHSVSKCSWNSVSYHWLPYDLVTRPDGSQCAYTLTSVLISQSSLESLKIEQRHIDQRQPGHPSRRRETHLEQSMFKVSHHISPLDSGHHN